jgi:hypothetical protein
MTQRNTNTQEQMAQEAKVEQTTVQLVQDRKTGEWYNPQERFMERMNSPEVMALLKRLKVR